MVSSTAPANPFAPIWLIANGELVRIGDQVVLAAYPESVGKVVGVDAQMGLPKVHMLDGAEAGTTLVLYPSRIMRKIPEVS